MCDGHDKEREGVLPQEVAPSTWTVDGRVGQCAVFDKTSEGRNVELTNFGWRLFDRRLTLEREERHLGGTEGDFDFTATRRGLTKLIPDAIAAPEKHATTAPPANTS